MAQRVASSGLSKIAMKAVADVLDEVAVVLGHSRFDDSRRHRFKRAWVPSSSCPMSRLKPAMSALMIAARRRAPLVTPVDDSPSMSLLLERQDRMRAGAGLPSPARTEIKALHPLTDGPWIFARATLDGSAARTVRERAGRGVRHPTGPYADYFPVPRRGAVFSVT